MKLKINNDDIVMVESPRGSIRIKAKVTDDIHPDVISIPHGWSNANANLLIAGDPQFRDPISAYPPFRTGLCRVRQISSSQNSLGKI